MHLTWAPAELPATAVAKMEWNIRGLLTDDISAISTMRCLKVYLERLGYRYLDKQDVYGMAGFAIMLAVESLYDLSLLNCRPSVVAAAILYAERRLRGAVPFWPSMLSKLTGYHDMSTPELTVAVRVAQKLSRKLVYAQMYRAQLMQLAGQAGPSAARTVTLVPELVGGPSGSSGPNSGGAGSSGSGAGPQGMRQHHHQHQHHHQQHHGGGGAVLAPAGPSSGSAVLMPPAGSAQWHGRYELAGPGMGVATMVVGGMPSAVDPASGLVMAALGPGGGGAQGVRGAPEDSAASAISALTQAMQGLSTGQRVMQAGVAEQWQRLGVPPEEGGEGQGPGR